MKGRLEEKVKIATKWSAVTEILAKLITPIVSIVLVHLLTPEAFGVVTTLTMIISFAEIFTDAGFQKYIIQHEFSDERDFEINVNVAFWSNIIIALIIWFLISLFSEPLATLVGNPGLGNVVVISCISIPLIAVSGIQVALYRRDLDFKTLFKVRMVSILVPLVVTVPLALLLKSYWALILGTIAQNATNSVILTLYSKWKPKLVFSFKKLKEMLSFTIWSIVESISIWLTSYVDIFIVGTLLSQYYLGLYKTSSSIVGQIMGLVTAVTTPILFSSLSRLQNDQHEFNRLFLKFQKYVSLLIMPLGVGIFCFSDFITSLLLGNQWTETSGFIGLWGLTSAITIVYSYFCSEIYRAKGYPKLSAISQWLHIIVLLPAILVSAKYGYETLYVTRSLVRLQLVLVNLIIMYYLVKISPLMMLKNTSHSLFSSLIMGFIGVILVQISDHQSYQFVSVLVCVVVYFAIIFLYKEERNIIKEQMLTRLIKR